MNKLTMGILMMGLSTASVAMADNALTTDQLQASIRNAVADYATVEPDMSKSISGLRVVAVGSNAQVTIEMKADGMNMSAKYLCVVQGNDMACQQQ